MNKFVIPGKVKEVTGSVTAPEHARLAIVFIPVPTSGEYSSDFYDKIVARWSKVKQDYREKFVNRENFKLGEMITTAVASDIWVVQGICLNEKNKVDKTALEACVKKLISMSKYETAFVHTSQLVFKAFPAVKKALVELVPPEGLNLYAYSDEEVELVKRG